MTPIIRYFMIVFGSLGNKPSGYVPISAIPINAITEPLTGDPITEPGTGAYITEP